MLAFVGILTVVSAAMFFIAIVNENYGGGYSIASIYVLCMLLAAPSLKVFLDKICCTRLKKCNVIGLVVIFLTIITLVTTSVITLAVSA